LLCLHFVVRLQKFVEQHRWLHRLVEWRNVCKTQLRRECHY
jgi:hypothetical protein